MTTTLQTIATVLRRVEAKVDHIESRLAFQYPTDRELSTQLEAEVEDILAGANLPRVFE